MPDPFWAVCFDPDGHAVVGDTSFKKHSGDWRLEGEEVEILGRRFYFHFGEGGNMILVLSNGNGTRFCFLYREMRTLNDWPRAY